MKLDMNVLRIGWVGGSYTSAVREFYGSAAARENLAAMRSYGDGTRGTRPLKRPPAGGGAYGAGEPFVIQVGTASAPSVPPRTATRPPTMSTGSPVPSRSG